MNKRYTIGLDYGTSSVRAVIIDVSDGSEVAHHVYDYPHGREGVVQDPGDPNLARQHPQDYIDGFLTSVGEAVKKAGGDSSFRPDRIIGIGIDTTGSSPMPVTRENTPLAFQVQFAEDTDAYVWLWKDHTSHAEASEITRLGRSMKPHYTAKIGQSYSSEWFWAKILHCLRVNAEVFHAAYTWMEIADWIPAVLCGITDADAVKRSVCAAGHKAMYHEDWGGYPEEDFLAALDERLVALRRTLPDKACDISVTAGRLSASWAGQMGIPAGLPVAVGAFDAHLGGVGAGISSGTMIKNIGTSSCDIMVAPLSEKLEDIPGMCGIVPGSVLPGYYGLEAGQSALGDIHGWFVDMIARKGEKKPLFKNLEQEAAELKPGESGLLALDWMNGNRTILVDQRLTGMILGLTLHSSSQEIYRSLLEASAFGARVIAERIEEYGMTIERIINCGGIPFKSPLMMQIYADVFGKTMELSRSSQTAALGAAIAGSVAAGPEAGGYSTCEEAMEHMTGVHEAVYEPIAGHAEVYDRLYQLYKEVHDAFGVEGQQADLYPVMKQLLQIKDEVRSV